MNWKIVCLYLSTSLYASVTGSAQMIDSSPVQQSLPELCGRPPDTVIPVITGLSVAVDRYTDHATLFIPVLGSAKKIELPGVVSYIAQVCPLPGNRAVVFGNAYQAMNVIVLDTASGSLLDDFFGVHPAMSPDQRWIAYEEFYPAHTDLPVSSRYRIYDLTKDAAKNRSVGISTEDPVNVGTIVFPVVKNGGDSVQLHEARLQSFTWAPDSKAVAFEDQVDRKRSIVLVRIGNDGSMSPHVFAMNATHVCSGNEVPNEQFIWDSLNLEVTTSPNRLVNVTVKGVKGCSPKQLTIFPQDFREVQPEQPGPAKKKAVASADVSNMR